MSCHFNRSYYVMTGMEMTDVHILCSYAYRHTIRVLSCKMYNFVTTVLAKFWCVTFGSSQACHAIRYPLSLPPVIPVIHFRSSPRFTKGLHKIIIVLTLLQTQFCDCSECRLFVPTNIKKNWFYLI